MSALPLKSCVLRLRGHEVHRTRRDVVVAVHAGLRLLPVGGRELLFVLAVGGDDALHELVAHDVLAGEVDELDVGDAVEDVAHLPEAGRALRQVDLRDVAGDDEPANRSRAG